MGDEDLFEVMPVEVELRPEDMPGRPLTRVRCEACGEHVQDGREVRRQGVVICKACSGNSYYKMEKASLCVERYAK
jgi:formylmethanofuran dehydrogenase subunit E